MRLQVCRGLPPLHPCCTGEQGWRSGGALASHKRGMGSNHDVDPICGLSLLLGSPLLQEIFSLVSPVFPSPQKNISKFQFDQEFGRRLRTTK